MDRRSRFRISLLLATIVLASAQQNCYFGPGAANRAPAEVVPCLNEGNSACCLQGDTCLTGNACYNYQYGDVYQYGCTDETYTDESCPFKCGFNTTYSPWTALEYCSDLSGVEDTWVCHSPESCGCDWPPTWGLLKLSPRGCKEMGSEARVALYAPSVLAPYVALPTTAGGSTGYFSTFTTDGTLTWFSTAISGYTPDSIGIYTTYAKAAPQSVIELAPNAVPAPATLPTPYTSASAAVVAENSNTLIAYTGQSTIMPSSSGASTQPTSKTSSGGGGGGVVTKTVTQDGQPVVTTSAAPSPTETGSGLSTGAKAGIGVGVAVGVILLAAIGILLFFRRKRKNQNQTPQQQDPDYMQGYQNEKTGAGVGGWHQPPHYAAAAEAPGSTYYDPHVLHEASYGPTDEDVVRKRMSPQEVPPLELDAGTPAHEMETPRGTPQASPNLRPT